MCKRVECPSCLHEFIFKRDDDDLFFNFDKECNESAKIKTNCPYCGAYLVMDVERWLEYLINDVRLEEDKQ